MDSLNHFQLLFFDQIKRKIPKQTSLVDDISTHLNISIDSAYRRLRGEKEMSFSEIINLAKTYDVSLDSIVSNYFNEVSFTYHSFSDPGYTLKKYLESILGHLEFLKTSNERKQMIYLSKDFPIFHYFRYPKICTFKMYFWQRFILNDPNYTNTDYNFEVIPKELLHLSNKIYGLYDEIPSIEIWNRETVNSTLNQIEFFHESGLFTNHQDVILLLEELILLLESIEKMAERGSKKQEDDKVENDSFSNYELHYNEVTIGDNTIFFKLGDDRKISFITANVLNILKTTNERFCADVEAMLSNLLMKSTKISVSSQKIRTKFFKIQYDKINNLISILR
ncbi:hypothetical protein QWY93_02865 [Echinicola jeungdonensis]|uniref:Transcription regulator BetR N-terminal domain-containing protein n=1 Tax=Echinicola jeungdonensis TaxID=709343 RepID=A0ABV5J0T3_9BACT|nr:hypothetical protein [Echinicola jeungdonensis]MDN3668269.1 hypothetical protein [Echinicola jeungdonensis]